MTGFMLNMIGGSLWSLAGLVLGSLGWGGIVALVAGGLLLLTLWGKARKFLSSPRGMAVTAAVMLIGLAFMWLARWTWGKPQMPPAQPVASLQPRAEQPEPEAAELAVEPEAEPEQLQALEVEPEPTLKAARFTPMLPMIPVVETVAGFVPPLSSPTTMRLPPVIVPLPRRTVPQRQAGKSTHTVTTYRGSGPGAAKAPAGRIGNTSGGMMGSAGVKRPGMPSSSSLANGPSNNGGSQLTAVQQARQARAIQNRQMNQAVMNSPSFNPWSPTGVGMNRMGGAYSGGMGMNRMGGMNNMGSGRR